MTVQCHDKRIGILAAALAAVFVLAAPIAAKADTYLLDSEHTEVRFSWDHLGMSRQSGRFVDVAGTVEFDPSAPSSSKVDVILKLSGLTTNIPALDEHLLKTKDFFDAEQHPAITFKSTSVKMTGEKTALVGGDLSINGITKPVMLDVVWNFTGDHPMASINPTYTGKYSSGFSASTQILRSDWGITRSIPYVSDELQITIETEMHRAGSGTAGGFVFRSSEQ